jgi:outer membrane receptor protein involved in Fe transport
MVYANVAKGFRSGGFNNTSAGLGIYPVPPTYRPDEIWTYEVGTKHQLFDNKVTLDASVFHSIWTDVQSNSFVPGSTLIVVTNSGKVKGWGIDLGVTARPTQELTLSGTLGLNNLEFKGVTADKLPGDPVDGAVRESWSASVDYRPALTDSITGIFRVDYQHAGKSRITARNFANGIIVRPGRDLVNLRVGAAVGPVEIALFADNLFDENNPLILGPFGVLAENLEQRPRVIGISFNGKF